MAADAPPARGRAVGYQRYQFPPGEDDEQLQPGLFPTLHGPVEVGSDGLPTGVELEQLVDEESEARDPGEIVAPFQPENIRIETQTVTVGLLLSRLREGMIDLAPDFQRRAGIWTDVQQSRLIESLLLRIPISSFHMAQDGEDNWAVVDGIQRLTAIARFMALCHHRRLHVRRAPTGSTLAVITGAVEQPPGAVK